MVTYLDATARPDLLSLSPVLAELAGRRAARTREPHFLLRRSTPYLLLGPRDRRLSGLGCAVRDAERRGLPVYERSGGGSLVYLDEGCLCFAAAIPGLRMDAIAENFRELTRPVFTALRELGLKPRFGAALGSYCEGPWDILADSRKIAGVSQSLRQGYTLVAGMLLIDQDPVRATREVEAFYAAAGAPQALDAGAVTNLGCCLGRSVTWQEVAAAITRELGAATPCMLEPQLLEDGLGLLAERRVPRG